MSPFIPFKNIILCSFIRLRCIIFLTKNNSYNKNYKIHFVLRLIKITNDKLYIFLKIKYHIVYIN